MRKTPWTPYRPEGCTSESLIVPVRTNMYLSGYCKKVMGNPRHVASDVFTAIVDARIQESEKGDLDELATTERHKAGILGGDAKFKEVELVDVLEKRTGVCKNPARRVAADAAIDADEHSVGGGNETKTYCSMLNRSFGMGSYASPFRRRN